jgi:hypothetical protein
LTNIPSIPSLKSKSINGNGDKVTKFLFKELNEIKQGKTPSILDNMTIDGLEENEKKNSGMLLLSLTTNYKQNMESNILTTLTK